MKCVIVKAFNSIVMYDDGVILAKDDGRILDEVLVCIGGGL